MAPPSGQRPSPVRALPGDVFCLISSVNLGVHFLEAR